jgi:hypothetical protein
MPNMTIALQPDRERAIEEALRAADPARTPARESRLWELRQGLALGELTIKELIEEGRE